MIQPSFARQLGLCICNINVSVNKIDNSKLETYGMIIALFQVYDEDKKFCFFKEILRIANISIDVAFAMLFLNLSNVEINFNNQKLR